MQPRLSELDLGTTLYRLHTARTLEELWPDEDRRDDALMRLLLKVVAAPLVSTKHIELFPRKP